MTGGSNQDDELPAIWTSRFEEDIRKDDRFERDLLWKEWFALAALLLLVLVRRLVM